MERYSHTPLFNSGITSEIIESLLNDIRGGKYQGGDKLPSERELCKEFAASRGSVREALRSLAVMGLIKIINGKGTYVLDTNERSREYYAFWNSVYPVPIQELVEVRFAVEPLAAAMVARKATADDLEELRDDLELMEQAKARERLEERVEADVQFHMGILELTGNRLFVDLFQNIDSMLRESRRISLMQPERVGKVHEYHQVIYQAIAQGHPEAAYQAMWRHLDSFRQEMNIKTDFPELPLGLVE